MVVYLSVCRPAYLSSLFDYIYNSICNYICLYTYLSMGVQGSNSSMGYITAL